MYQQSKNVENINIANRHTRAAEKLVFNIPSRCTTNFFSSPYHIGTQLWNNLPGDTQLSENSLKFESNIHVLPLYKTYQGPNDECKEL